MESTSIEVLAPVHRLSVEQFQRMEEAGVFVGDVRVELIDGVMVEVNASGQFHTRAVNWLNRELVPQLDDDHMVSPQNSIVLRELRSMPQPDIAIVALEDLADRVPERPLLIIEVSDSKLGFDRITKSRLYARHGIEDYWILNVREQVVEVHRGPTDEGWSSRTLHGPGVVLRPLLLPQVTLALAPLLAFTVGPPSAGF